MLPHCNDLLLPQEPAKEDLLLRSLRADPHSRKRWAELIDFYWISDDPHSGLKAWEECKNFLPNELRPYVALGNIQRDLNNFEASDQAFELATALAPQWQGKTLGWNHSQVVIGLEQYQKAYTLAEHRFELIHHQHWRTGPYWQGFDQTKNPNNEFSIEYHGPKLIIVWSEQGVGDTLQYVRWIPLLLQMGRSVQLEVEPPLVHLLRQGLAWVGGDLTVIPKGIGPRLAENACHGSLLSLPWLLGGAPLAEVFKLKEGGYLRSAEWTRPNRIQRSVPRVGIVWASGRKQGHPFLRREYLRKSIPTTNLLTLLQGLKQIGAELVCLQYGSDRQQASEWQGSFAEDLPDGVNLADTARCIANLDLVITVDTAMAHLVGAMAAPGWVLLPWAADPRWLRDRGDSPWYPSLTLLRQPSHRDWNGLVQNVLEQFQCWITDWLRR